MLQRSGKSIAVTAAEEHALSYAIGALDAGGVSCIDQLARPLILIQHLRLHLHASIAAKSAP